MPIGDKASKQIPLPDLNILGERPAVAKSLLENLVQFLNDCLKEREAPLYIFFQPDIAAYAEKLKASPKDTFEALMCLSGFYPDFVALKAILDRDGLFYILQDEDIEEVKTSNTLHNPFNPKIVYSDAKEMLRHAFVLNLGRHPR
jgi:hypothetical protein